MLPENLTTTPLHLLYCGLFIIIIIVLEGATLPAKRPPPPTRLGSATTQNAVAHQIARLCRRPRDLTATCSPTCVRFFALGSFMQILVDLANLMNGRSVRRPHALDPGHDLPTHPPVSLTIATVYPVPSQNRTVSDASPPPAATRHGRIRLPLSSLDVN